eukprot:1000988-Prymnesium_polylepis.2
MGAALLEGERVCTDAVKEPPIVRHDDRAACKVMQRLLKGPQRVDVKIVARLVEQQEVAPGATVGCALGQPSSIVCAHTWRAWHMARGTWHMAHGTWRMAHGDGDGHGHGHGGGGR